MRTFDILFYYIVYMKNITESEYYDKLNSLYVMSHNISIDTLQILYDRRFEDQICLSCKTLVSEICATCCNIDAFIDFLKTSDEHKFESTLTEICNNVAICVETIRILTQKYTDMLIYHSTEPSVLDSIDKYSELINEFEQTTNSIIAEYLTDDTKSIIESLRDCNKNDFDADDDSDDENCSFSS